MSVYFAQVGHVIKVGFSESPERRVANLMRSSTGSHLPQGVTPESPRSLLKVIDGDKSTELRIHRALVRFHIFLEWFVDEPEVRAFIENVGTADDYSVVPRPNGRPPINRDLGDFTRAQVARSIARLQQIGAQPYQIRQWARREGLPVAARGAIPSPIVAAYMTAHHAADLRAS